MWNFLKTEDIFIFLNCLFHFIWVLHNTGKRLKDSDQNLSTCESNLFSFSNWKGDLLFKFLDSLRKCKSHLSAEIITIWCIGENALSSSSNSTGRINQLQKDMTYNSVSAFKFSNWANTKEQHWKEKKKLMFFWKPFTHFLKAY